MLETYILCHGEPNQNSYRQKSPFFKFINSDISDFAILQFLKYLLNAFDSQRCFLSHETKFASLTWPR